MKHKQPGGVVQHDVDNAYTRIPENYTHARKLQPRCNHITTVVIGPHPQGISGFSAYFDPIKSTATMSLFGIVFGLNAALSWVITGDMRYNRPRPRKVSGRRHFTVKMSSAGDFRCNKSDKQCVAVTDYKVNDLEWPWVAISCQTRFLCQHFRLRDSIFTDNCVKVTNIDSYYQRQKWL